MSEQWYAVVIDASGEAISFGTVVADPLPPEFVALPLLEADADAINAGRGYWNVASRSVVMRPEAEWPVLPG
jgi:hypothetical protein